MEQSIWVTPVFLSLVQKLPTLDCAMFSKQETSTHLSKKIKKAFLSSRDLHHWGSKLTLKWTGGNEENSERFSQNGCISCTRSVFFCVSSLNLLTPRCSSAVGSVWLCAWDRRTVRSCSSPGWWRSVMTGRCRSRCSTGGGRRRPPRAGRRGSSWRWWWPGLGPGCTTTSCPSLRHGSPEDQMTVMLCSTLGTVNLIESEMWKTGSWFYDRQVVPV